MSFGNDLREDLLDLVFAGEAYTAVDDFEIALSTTAINDDGTGITEPEAADGYARVEVPNNLTNWPAATTEDGDSPDGVTTKTNGEEIQFPVATGTWGLITHCAIYDEDTGDFLAWGTLVTPRTIEEDDIAVFQEESIEITLS